MGLKVDMYDTGCIITGFPSPDPFFLFYNNFTPEDQFTVKMYCEVRLTALYKVFPKMKEASHTWKSADRIQVEQWQLSIVIGRRKAELGGAPDSLGMSAEHPLQLEWS